MRPLMMILPLSHAFDHGAHWILASQDARTRFRKLGGEPLFPDALPGHPPTIFMPRQTCFNFHDVPRHLKIYHEVTSAFTKYRRAL